MSGCLKLSDADFCCDLPRSSLRNSGYSLSLGFTFYSARSATSTTPAFAVFRLTHINLNIWYRKGRVTGERVFSSNKKTAINLSAPYLSNSEYVNKNLFFLSKLFVSLSTVPSWASPDDVIECHT